MKYWRRNTLPRLKLRDLLKRIRNIIILQTITIQTGQVSDDTVDLIIRTCSAIRPARSRSKPSTYSTSCLFRSSSASICLSWPRTFCRLNSWFCQINRQNAQRNSKFKTRKYHQFYLTNGFLVLCFWVINWTLTVVSILRSFNGYRLIARKTWQNDMGNLSSPKIASWETSNIPAGLGCSKCDFKTLIQG